MRRLAFSTEQQDRERYDLCYGSFCLRNFDHKELRIADRAMTKFENIGHKVDNQVPYELAGPAEVILEEDEYRLQLETIKQMRWSGNGRRIALGTIDWLEGLKIETPE